MAIPWAILVWKKIGNIFLKEPKEFFSNFDQIY